MTTITIQNLKCGGCANTINNKLIEIEGITNISVDVDLSTITFNNETLESLINAKQKLAAIGYPENGEKNSVVSKAKSFVSCATGKINA